MHLDVTYSDTIDTKEILESDYNINASLVLTYAFTCDPNKYTLTVNPNEGTWRGIEDIQYFLLDL